MEPSRGQDPYAFTGLRVQDSNLQPVRPLQPGEPAQDPTRNSFNPPPGWPRAPDGWTPQPGWRPDPSWPPAPPGWQFIVPSGTEGLRSPDETTKPSSRLTHAMLNLHVWHRWLLGAMGVVIVVVAVMLISDGSSSPKGYNDPVKLGADIAAQKTAEQTDGSSVSVTCLHAGGTQFTCHAIWSDSTPESSFTATVPPDGSTWITKK
jgi:hypothetical protein